MATKSAKRKVDEMALNLKIFDAAMDQMMAKRKDSSEKFLFKAVLLDLIAKDANVRAALVAAVATDPETVKAAVRESIAAVKHSFMHGVLRQVQRSG